jgi:nucleotide-binding universal stress UspA family protein
MILPQRIVGIRKLATKQVESDSHLTLRGAVVKPDFSGVLHPPVLSYTRGLSMAKQICPTPGFAKLLVATDGSADSQAAVHEAIRIASACSSTLYVLLVIEINAEVEIWDARSADKLEKDMRKYLDGIKAKAAKAGVTCEVLLHLGDEPYRYIVDEAKKRKINTIIMGSHGRTGLAWLLMGSVVSRVIGHAPCKVLVVPVRANK